MDIKIFDCSDKTNHDKHNREHLLQFGKPFSCLIIGVSNCGKTNLIKNIIENNEFKIIYVMHADPDSKDYDDIPHIKYEIGEDYIDRFREYSELPKCLIIDDVDFRNLNKKQQNWFYKMVTYTRAHCNLTIICSAQDAIYYPPIIRRTFPIIIVYKYIELEPLKKTQAYNVLSKKSLQYALSNLTKTDYDFVLINNKSKRSWISINNKLQLLSDNSMAGYYDIDESDEENNMSD